MIYKHVCMYEKDLICQNVIFMKMPNIFVVFHLILNNNECCIPIFFRLVDDVLILFWVLYKTIWHETTNYIIFPIQKHYWGYIIIIIIRFWCFQKKGIFFGNKTLFFGNRIGNSSPVKIVENFFENIIVQFRCCCFMVKKF